MTDYTSICFLLPQLRDREQLMNLYGAIAFAQAEWFHTVTFSADDACKYDICFAVNPSQIGTGLTQEWFDRRNTKTKLIALEISSLGELVEKLRGGLGVHEPINLPQGRQDES